MTAQCGCTRHARTYESVWRGLVRTDDVGLGVGHHNFFVYCHGPACNTYPLGYYFLATELKRTLRVKASWIARPPFMLTIILSLQKQD